MVQAHRHQAIRWAQLSHWWFIKHVLKSSLRSSLLNTAPLTSARGRFSTRGETSNCMFWIEGYREAAVDLLIWQWTIFSKSHQSIQIPDFKPKNFLLSLTSASTIVKPWLLSSLNADIYYFSYLKIPKCACSVFQVLWTGSSLYLRAASSCFQSACAPCVLPEKCECIDLFGFSNR